MRILLIVSAFNSLAQRIYCQLQDLNHIVSVQFAIDNKSMLDEINIFKPDIIICPFLKKFIPKEIFNKIPTFILHPGIIGDRGPHSLDNAIREDKEEWGVVVLRANEEFDGGDIYSQINYTMRDTYKASIYRNEVNNAGYEAIDELLKNLQNKDFKPTCQLLTPIHEILTQGDRQIDWTKDNTKKIIKKINFSDSFPGVLDEILDIKCFLFGAWEEEKFKGKPKEILAKRDGAICIGTIDGAVWITHLKEVNKFKLPATYILKDKIKGIKEDRLPLIFDKNHKTFYEISCDIKDSIGYLHFNFHNGAMSANQCIKLKYAFEFLKESCKIVVLMGGNDFFSNGIHLNILEDSKKNGEDGWSNINAMNDLVRSVLMSDDVITVCSFGKNAGAGGVFLGLACDYVVGCDSVVLNPHYKTLGLSGSEYHTFSLPKRVGKELSSKLLNECLPISIKKANNIGMVDKVLPRENYINGLNDFCQNLIKDEDIYDDFIWSKQDFIEENKELIEQYRKDEIKIMYPEFWNKNSAFHKLRYDFVYKVCPTSTPERLKYKE